VDLELREQTCATSWRECGLCSMWQVAMVWATCLFTKNAVLRILGQPRYPNSRGPPAVWPRLVAELIRHRSIRFWPDSLSLLTKSHVDGIVGGGW